MNNKIYNILGMMLLGCFMSLIYILPIATITYGWILYLCGRITELSIILVTIAITLCIGALNTMIICRRK